MTNTTFSLLDQDELMQLAVNASGGGDSASAIAYLKQAVARPDARAVAHYLLGAEYAQIKMYERATGSMEAALALDPGLSIARLQLGLLWLSSGAAPQAASVLAPLQELAEGDALRCFGAGLTHLMAERMAEARAALLEGIAANHTNAPLNGDMHNIVAQIDLLAEPPAAEAVERHVLLSAYTGNTSH